MSKTILAIDDSKKILDIIKYFLEQEGYTVKAFTAPEEGLKAAEEGGIDLILLDIMMPGMDGYTLCEKLKKSPAAAEVPVIMLTAKAIIHHTPKDFFYGLYGFLAKPFTKLQLLKLVAECVGLTSKSGKGTTSRRKAEGAGDKPQGPAK